MVRIAALILVVGVLACTSRESVVARAALGGAAAERPQSTPQNPQKEKHQKNRAGKRAKSSEPQAKQSEPAAPAPETNAPPGAHPVANHEYFERLKARPEYLAAYSLRDQAQLERYRARQGRDPAITYDPEHDPDARRQDAAKVVVPADKVKLLNQVRLPIPLAPDGLLVTWDAWFGREFRYEQTSIEKYKTFQFASPADRVSVEIRTRFDRAKKLSAGNAIALVDARAYGAPGKSLGPNVTRNQPLSPQAHDFVIAPETWTRYWAQFLPQPNKEWYEFSLWVADEKHDAVLVIDRLQMKPLADEGWRSFWLEFNTSAYGKVPGRKPLIAYVRNVVMLRKVPDVARLLERPGKS